MLSLLKEGTICTSVWQESNSLLSVCIWMGALMLCLHWASMYQLVVQRVLWHWTCPESSLLNRVSSQHEPVHVKRTLLQLEQGQSGNMLVIVVSCHRASMRPLYFFVDLIVMSLGLGVDQTPFPATSTFLRCAARRSWLTASQPHD